MRTLALVFIAAALAACGGGGGDSGGVDDPGGGGPGGSGGEPNDTIAQATVISVNSSIAAELSTSTDQDFYKFVVPAGGLTVRLETFDSTGTGCAGVDPSLALYNQAGTTLAANDDGGIGQCDVLTRKLPEGVYFVEVDGLPYETPFSYVLSVRALTGTAVTESEPNDDGSVAVDTLDFSAAAADGPFTSPTIVTGSINPAGDDDFFAVTNPYPYRVVVHLETFQTWDGAVGTCPNPNTGVFYNTELAVYDASGARLAATDDGGLFYCSALKHELAAGETVYVRVTNWHDAGTLSSYQLLIDI